MTEPSARLQAARERLSRHMAYLREGADPPPATSIIDELIAAAQEDAQAEVLRLTFSEDEHKAELVQKLQDARAEIERLRVALIAFMDEDDNTWEDWLSTDDMANAPKHWQFARVALREGLKEAKGD